MNLRSNKNTIVIGAGGGGIASALLASLRGEKVTLIEAHSALGGCASWFKRGPYIFDAGATTLSGVGENEPVGELFSLLGTSPDLYASDPGIVFHLSNGKVIRYYRDFEKWMVELSEIFPGLNHRPFWELTRSINEKSWLLLKNIKTFPFSSITDYLDLLKHPKLLTLAPYLLLSTEHALKKFGLDQGDYLEFINGLLLISAQAHSEKIPFIVGAMALSYPAQTFAPRGGMKGLMDFFEKELERHDVLVRKKTRVQSFTNNTVTLSDGETLTGERLIVNLPVWNMAQMYQGEMKKKFMKESESHPGSWGAFVLYFGVKSDIHELYHQVHLNHPLVKNYFVSFSIPHDELRAPRNYQAVTISTHVYADETTDKELLSKIILDDFLKRFPVSDIKFITTGSPKTFERYTGRLKGYVGGLPFLYGKNPFSMLGAHTSEEEVFRVGDTVFPGQGLCGVVAGAMGLHRRLKISGG